MSRERALKAIGLMSTDRVPQLEYMAHPQYQSEVTGLDPSAEYYEMDVATCRALDLDMTWYDAPRLNWRQSGDGFDYQVSEWGTSGSPWTVEYPVSTLQEVLTFDPIKHFDFYYSMSPEARARELKAEYQRIQELYGEIAYVPGGYYMTSLMWPIMTFGWPLFLEAIGGKAATFREIIERFLPLSRMDMQSWAQVETPLFIAHDDLCMTRGPIFNPNWYREHLFPLYADMWRPLKEKGTKILFCSDGDITNIVDDLVQAGADGFIIEPCVDLQWLVERYGGNTLIVGNVSTRTLTFGTAVEVQEEVERCVHIVGDCPGFFLSATGSMPQNIPIENARAYFAACSRMRQVVARR